MYSMWQGIKLMHPCWIKVLISIFLISLTSNFWIVVNLGQISVICCCTVSLASVCVSLFWHSFRSDSVFFNFPLTSSRSLSKLCFCKHTWEKDKQSAEGLECVPRESSSCRVCGRLSMCHSFSCRMPHKPMLSEPCQTNDEIYLWNVKCPFHVSCCLIRWCTNHATFTELNPKAYSCKCDIHAKYTFEMFMLTLFLFRYILENV